MRRPSLPGGRTTGHALQDGIDSRGDISALPPAQGDDPGLVRAIWGPGREAPDRCQTDAGTPGRRPHSSLPPAPTASAVSSVAETPFAGFSEPGASFAPLTPFSVRSSVPSAPSFSSSPSAPLSSSDCSSSSSSSCPAGAMPLPLFASSPSAAGAVFRFFTGGGPVSPGCC